MFQRTRGFTLVELMVAVAVLAILVTVAAPVFTSSIQKTRADSEASDLMRALNYTRLEAINRGVNVRIAPTAVGGSWTQELTTRLSPAGNVLRVTPAMSTAATVASNNVAFIEFNNLGGLASPAANTTLTFVEGAYTNAVTVCLTGRIVLNGVCQ
ncbi:prepilin-type cleavage/methylation domain-containing protein [Pseudomonas gingeri NCPPB 3146 = LMG 5327]|uniref:Type II secretion system protein H n=2 Tax=Pseudomonas gingeri TaxID=117681 RepID=A0A7Y8CG52_9PSED|nr:MULTISPECIES: GspH/FimT family pseudopilin [Pseudomonas]NVZ25716.1 GspH/FimT family pseudopilin [Pseudomonas gingeri]NWA04440.1 GspH/FimT family pseudopilin [Pseudomonas gingeri]NWA15583.1 GspH/FimT family pseudopilin [Pseudomonas gingeri]NWA58245.1 GspH/FimT family pseudopilin [Pseudomonas gingeri]NWA96079.1 GspH/FimT family pseudopilin [Pseudomonas gingeri]